MNYSILPQSFPPGNHSPFSVHLNTADDSTNKVKPNLHSSSSNIAPDHVIPIPEVIFKIREEERTKIGEELHDSVNPLLCIAKLFIDSMNPAQESDINFKNEAREVLLSAIENIRYISAELEVSQRANSTLSQLVKRLVARIQKLNCFKISFTLLNDAGIATIHHDQKTALFRIIQELLNNAIKYSKAKDVWIKLSYARKIVYVTIEDNGAGFETSDDLAGVGLLNIARTVKLYKGQIKLKSAPAKGSKISITMPVQKQE